RAGMPGTWVGYGDADDSPCRGAWPEDGCSSRRGGCTCRRCSERYRRRAGVTTADASSGYCHAGYAQECRRGCTATTGPGVVERHRGPGGITIACVGDRHSGDTTGPRGHRGGGDDQFTAIGCRAAVLRLLLNEARLNLIVSGSSRRNGSLDLRVAPTGSGRGYATDG